MNTDIRVSVNFKGNRKRRRLNILLGCEATGYLIDLWITVAEERPEGLLINWDIEDIANAAGWQEEPQMFVDSLIKAKLLDKDGNVYKLHDWEDHQPWVVGAPARSEAAKVAANARWSKEKSNDDDTDLMRDDAERMPAAQNSNAESMRIYAPSPYPLPDPIPSPLPDPLPENTSTDAQAHSEPIKNSENKKPCKSKKEPKLKPEVLHEVEKTEAWLEQTRGYKSPRFPAERNAIAAMVKIGFGADQICACWSDIKKDKFYQDKELFMMTVQGQIQNWEANQKKKVLIDPVTRSNTERMGNGNLTDREWENPFKRQMALEGGHIPPMHIIRKLAGQGKWPDPRFPELAEKAEAVMAQEEN